MKEEEAVKMSGIELAKECDVSYRQMDYWCRKGFIHTDVVGSGYARFIEGSEIEIFRLVCKLVKCGLTVEAAAVAARRMVTDGLNWTVLPSGVRIEIGQDDVD